MWMREPWAWIAQTDSIAPDLIQQGALAAVLVALLLGQLVTKPSVEQERKLSSEAIDRMNNRVLEANARAAKAEQQRDTLLEELGSALPALRAATDAAVTAAEASNRVIVTVEDAIERFEREVRGRRGA